MIALETTPKRENDIIVLHKGDASADGSVEILDEDRLCFLVRNKHGKSCGDRTIAKALLREFIEYYKSNPKGTANAAATFLTGKSTIDKFEYGYESTLWKLAILNESIPNRSYEEPLHQHVKRDKYNLYLKALRTKPFLLLAGFSGTGKSRIVRELAFKCCPFALQDKEKTTPGNYLMVEVKPNWHDSTELLGYYSNIQNKYILTSFVRFLCKARKNPEVPFFVCLDEMNLAPVEQYFAEFLSVLETRKLTKTGIVTGVLVEKENLVELGETEDLTLPANVFVVGTVNMDDTTHQFSRKVIDRAMTIEMNGGNLENMFGHSMDLDYIDNPWTMDNELQVKYINADEVLAAHTVWADKIKTVLLQKLNAINECLNNTPFLVSYRVLNELSVYLGVLLDDAEPVDNAKFDELVETAVDQILLMKILPRIEGDAEMFNLTEGEKQKLQNKNINNKLYWLMDICPNVDYANDEAMTSKKKLEEMICRMNSGFTRYWP